LQRQVNVQQRSETFVLQMTLRARSMSMKAPFLAWQNRCSPDGYNPLLREFIFGSYPHHNCRKYSYNISRIFSFTCFNV